MRAVATNWTKVIRRPLKQSVDANKGRVKYGCDIPLSGSHLMAPPSAKVRKSHDSQALT